MARSKEVLEEIIEGLADDWGPKDDEFRPEFIVGARSVAFGEPTTISHITLGSAAALHSGIIAAREEGLP